MIEEGLRTLLLAESTVTALVNGATTGELRGVYVDSVPQGAPLDHVLITTLHDSQNNTLGGGDASGAGAMHTATLDIDCRAASPGAAKALAAAVIAFLADYEGAAGSQTILAVMLNDRTTDPERPTSGESRHLHVETLDVDIQYRP